ncbi:hypothetical protein Mal35_57710 [Gimesia maris]|jgi:hypothetical protein|uniref:Uncharacterized protein n=1 Tax=Gimesia maris TaxID=122 RepID=A0A3D3R997_9PLAN|nr:hypothetical protein [Gimesia maris]MAC55171.1 hypothetical protein [Gimesia sp.]QDT82278.1 hypothetical protein Mal35_57710 [Gimesia maris]HCO24662.1 hypothetical protein [Gimesia maris]|tara:strand:- start:92001 stop:92606 length:606 start_codon:yes stop_codon:yes gene_type:complete
MLDSPFSLEFEISTPARFDALQRFFFALKSEKDQILKSWDSDAEEDQYDPVDEPNWIDYLDEEAIEWFSDFLDLDSPEGITFSKLWELTEPEYRCVDNMFHLPGHWDFESLLESLFNGEYVLVDLRGKTDTTGELIYDPWAGPFGGTEPLVELIEAFGQTVTYDSWHEGPHRRCVVGWDYELAKKLVAEGKGYIPNQEKST